jgi:alanine-alpha-ketoisovalerate/valine-pyruvate aminotransferase
MKFITMPEVLIALTPGSAPSSLSNIGLPGANRCGIIIINDSVPGATTCGVNPVTRRAYCY